MQDLALTFVTSGDLTRQAKLSVLRSKWERGETGVAFSGHFSAGKSTLINALLGVRTLPASPLPTSANVVRLHFGKPGATAYLSGGEVRRLTDWTAASQTALQSWCRDGDAVERVEIAADVQLLADGLTFYDTPGVDSTDVRHAVQTREMLYLADWVIYVADYHHVLSDINIHYLRSLSDEGKRLILVVSQMDKHSEWEESLADFKANVEQALTQWQIAVEGVWYVAAAGIDCAGNQLAALRAKLLTVKDETNATAALVVSLHRLLSEHWQWLREQAGVTPEALTQAFEVTEQLAARKKAQASKRAQLQQQMSVIRSDLMSLIGQAILLPYETTELAVSYIESLHPHFRAGFWSSKSKVITVRAERLALFAKSVRARIHEQLERHLRQQLLKAERTHGWHLSVLLDQLATIGDNWTEQSLMALVSSGADLDRLYGYQYGKQVDETIRDRYRRFVTEVMQSLERTSEAESAIDVAVDDESACHPALALCEQERAWQAQEQDLRARSSQLFTTAYLLPSSQSPTYQGGHLVAATLACPELPQELETADQTALQAGTVAAPVQLFTLGLGAPDTKQMERERSEIDCDAVCRRLEQAAQLCAEASLATLASNLLERSRRIRGRQFTVALFGAFSAGKSTLINALLGDSALPVSPSPATAVISRVLPPTEAYLHQTARIQYKTEAALRLEIAAASATLGLQTPLNLEQLEQELTGIDELTVGVDERSHLAFLQAIAVGWQEFLPLLGQERDLQLSDFAAAVAREERAAFAERIDLYYASPLAAAGIILVDTPGADSIHARHTDVAFRYLRDADAIVFVTYFNHAFAKADREFLEQLGRVKEALAFDSLHVVINACDLAQDEDEVKSVRAYVEAELLKAGVRKPRLYTLSSQIGMLARMGQSTVSRITAEKHLKQRLRLSPESSLPALTALWQSSGVPALMADVLSHTRGRLMEQAVMAAEQELERLRKYLLERVHAKASEQQTGEARLAFWQDKFVQANQLWTLPATAERQALAEELAELVYHIGQRLQFAHNDLVISAFHPSQLSHASDTEVSSVVREWLRRYSVLLGQEVRATAIVVARNVRMLMEQRTLRYTQQLSEEGFSLQALIEPLSTMPDVVPAYPDWSDSGWPLRIQKLLRQHLRSREHFFERGGRKAFAVALENVANELSVPYLTDVQAQFAEAFGAWLEQAATGIAADLRQQTSALLEIEARAGSDAHAADPFVHLLANWPPL